jgi:hypothetical protein
MEELALGKFHMVPRRAPVKEPVVTESAPSSDGPFADEEHPVPVRG